MYTSMSKLESALEFRCEFPGRFSPDPCASFLRKPVYGLILACQFAFHPLGLPVVPGSLPELWDAQGDDGRELE